VAGTKNDGLPYELVMCGLTPTERAVLKELLARYGLAAVEQAFSEAARLGKRPVPYTERRLRGRDKK